MLASRQLDTVYFSPIETNKQDDDEEDGSTPLASPPPLKDRGIQCPTILHGEPLTDRKSTFQAHVAAVMAVEEVCVCGGVGGIYVVDILISEVFI